MLCVHLYRTRIRSHWSIWAGISHVCRVHTHICTVIRNVGNTNGNACACVCSVECKSGLRKTKVRESQEKVGVLGPIRERTRFVDADLAESLPSLVRRSTFRSKPYSLNLKHVRASFPLSHIYQGSFYVCLLSVAHTSRRRGIRKNLRLRTVRIRSHTQMHHNHTCRFWL